MLDVALLNVHADRLRASEALGRSKAMRRLFDFLVACSATGKAPKEIEVAIDVFDRGVSFEPSQDALVRVYVYKLRRKLEHYYLGPGSHERVRLVIPKGEYRVLLETVPAIPAVPVLADVQHESTAVARSAASYWKAGALACLLTLANVGLWLMAGPQAVSASTDLLQAQASPIWAPVLSNQRPTYVVVGDYYLIGELDERSWQVQRLVREFDVNSGNELQQYVADNPQFADRYMDLSLQYLPTSVGFALQYVIPMLRSNDTGSRKVQLVLASDVTPAMVKGANIIYVGLLSGMHLLEQLVFAGSQLKVGYSYDELVERGTDRHYISQAGSALQGTTYRDFGYFSTFAGPSGNRIVILAGTRDVAVMHVAETLTHPESLEQLVESTQGRADFEALYSVEAIDRQNLGGELMFVSPLRTATMGNEAVR